MSFTIGADPEVFVARRGKFVSAHGLVPGTKQEPYRVPDGAVQVDGIALEFNVDPSATYEEFQKKLGAVWDTLTGMIPGYDLIRASTIKLTDSIVKKTPEESLVLGCNPDVNAYTEGENDPPDGDVDFRSAGGHVHIGDIFTKEDDREKWQGALRLARLMDQYVGVYSVLWDSDTERRKLYGQAGACRPKDYGVEYRTLSNAWVFDQDLTKLLYEGTARAVAAWRAGQDVDSYLYRDIINASDVSNDFFKGNAFAERVLQVVSSQKK